MAISYVKKYCLCMSMKIIYNCFCLILSYVDGLQSPERCVYTYLAYRRHLTILAILHLNIDFLLGSYLTI